MPLVRGSRSVSWYATPGTTSISVGQPIARTKRLTFDVVLGAIGEEEFGAHRGYGGHGDGRHKISSCEANERECLGKHIACGGP